MHNHFDEMLEQLNVELINMGALCEDAIAFSVQMLSEAGEQENKVAAIEEEINGMERKIENMCMKLLLRQQPVAKDLRQISAALKMISDMERIGDQALDISEMARFINTNQSKNTKLYEMARATIYMVTRAIDSFVKKDLAMAREVMAYDDVVDNLFAEIKREVIAEIGEKEGEGEYLADVLMVSKYLERIGDHAVNIAEWVEYSITGTHALGKFEK
ncbi:MAG: phosphate signaling complex protein PhoU [Lachnospiraceae bacterium]|nr:phosphate signaling complex protein PhoU [Lachnospiraceae bacterium]